jgi:carbonic anhydrase
MNFLKQILEHNKKYIQEHKKLGDIKNVSKIPRSEVAILTGHKDCGMTNIIPEEIEQKMIQSGVSVELLRGIESTGIDLHPFKNL